MPTVVVESICRVQNAILPDVVVDGSSGALDSNNMTADDLTVTDGVAFLKDVRVLGNLVLEPALSNGIFGSNLAVTGSFNASGNLANMDIVINGLTIENGSLVLFEDFNQCVISGLLIGTQGSSGPTSGAGRVIIQDVIGFKISGVVMGAYRHGCYIEGSSYGEVDLVVFDPSQQTTGNSHGFYLYNNDNITVKGSVFGAHWVVNQPGYGWRVDSNNTNIHMDVHVIGALTGEFLNEAGTETTMVPRMGADSPDDGDVLTWDVAEGMYRPVLIVPGWITQLTARSDTPHSDDDEFDDDSFSGWTKIENSAVETIVEKNGLLSVAFDGGALGASKVNAWVKALGDSSPITIEICHRIPMGVSDTGFLMSGPIFTDGTATSANMYWGHTHHDVAGVMRLEIHAGTPASVGSALGSSEDLDVTPFWYQRAIWVSSNTFRHEFSPDGVSWYSHNGDQAKTLTPTHYGFGLSNWDNANIRIASLEYFRVFV